MRIKNVGKHQRSTSPPFPPPVPTPGSTQGHRPARATPVSEAELEAWLKQAKDLPDIRWEKVRAMREAVRNRTLDTDDRLSELADRLPAMFMESLQQPDD